MLYDHRGKKHHDFYNHLYISFLLSIFHIIITLLPATTNAFKVAVFGGSGFIGRRVCRDLVGAGCEVLCISRSPPRYNTNNNLQWVQYDMNSTTTTSMIKKHLVDIDAAISCVGNLQPSKEWKGLWGLGWNDDQLRYENGNVNEQICQLAKEAGAKRFVFVSVSYEVAKMLEGPVEGYMDGKRHAEHIACQLFGKENTIVVGPSLVYGGKRFPKLGKVYRALVESAPAKAYVRGNDLLRSISVGEDWVEKTIFSSPVIVDVVSRVLSAGAMGMISRDMVGPRQQGFFDTNGQPVTYDDVLYVDGTANIERVDELVKFVTNTNTPPPLPSDIISSNSSNNKSDDDNEPPFEGALIGKGPYLYPFPVIALFSYLFWAVATQQFVQVASS